jgi:hypothetical protein
MTRGLGGPIYTHGPVRGPGVAIKLEATQRSFPQQQRMSPPVLGMQMSPPTSIDLQSLQTSGDAGRGMMLSSGGTGDVLRGANVSRPSHPAQRTSISRPHDADPFQHLKMAGRVQWVAEPVDPSTGGPLDSGDALSGDAVLPAGLSACAAVPPHAPITPTGVSQLF